MDEENETLISTHEGIHKLLDRQISTHQHLQTLSIGIIRALFAVLAILTTLIIAFREIIPSIPWQKVTVGSNLNLVYSIPISESTALLEVITNFAISIYGIALAFTILGEGIKFLLQILLADRLSYTNIGTETRIITLSESEIESLKLDQTLHRPQVEWVRSNAEMISRSDWNLRRGLYRAPISFLVAGFFSYTYLFSVNASFIGILMVQIAVLSSAIAVSIGLRRTQKDIEISEPTRYLGIVMVFLASSGILIFIYELANL